MKRAVIIISAVAILSGCSMVDVSTDNEDMTVEYDSNGTPQHKPSKGIVIHIPMPVPNV